MLVTTKSITNANVGTYSLVTVDEVLGNSSRLKLANTCGICTGYSPPYKTRVEYRVIYRVRDHTGQEVEFVQFEGSTDAFPKIDPVGCLLVVYQAKIQLRGSNSLLKNHQTFVLLYRPDQVPNLSTCTTPAYVTPSLEQVQIKHHQYAAQIAEIQAIYEQTQKPHGVPTQNITAIQGANANHQSQKFRQFKDVEPNIFCNMVVYLIEEPDLPVGDSTVIKVTDFTSNPLCGTNVLDTEKVLNSIAPENSVFRITLYGRHSTTFWGLNPANNRWFSLSNVRMKFNAGYPIEGAISELGMFPADVYVKVPSMSDLKNKESEYYKAYMRLKERIKARKKGIRGDVGGAADSGSRTNSGGPSTNSTARTASGAKSGIDGNARESVKGSLKEPRKQSVKEAAKEPAKEPAKNNGKARREAKRAAIESLERDETAAILPPNLNSDVACEKHTTYITPISEVNEYRTAIIPIDGEDVTVRLPFNLARYLVAVRVVDFSPNDIRDFTYPTYTYKGLEPTDVVGSGNDSDSDSDVSFDEAIMVRKWNWAFRLKLEDVLVSSKKNPAFVWVNVDNWAAEYLLGMGGADLHNDDTTLAIVKHQMNKLWGRLEDIKRAELEANQLKQLQRKKRDRDMPPVSSDDDDNDDNAGANAHATATAATAAAAAATSSAKARLRNARKNAGQLPFQCCLEQYGAVIPEKNEAHANAGPGKRYVRQYRLNYTKLSPAS